MTNPFGITPPDDTGADVAERMRYQARVAVPFCIDCLRGADVRSVTLEHLEDILIECHADWRFIQVKTRDPQLGPWRLTDALAGLASLLRAWHAVGNGGNQSFELHLEGAISRRDAHLNELRTSGLSRSANVIEAVASGLAITSDLAAEFLRVVTVVESPLRTDIRTRNIDLLGSLKPSLALSTVRQLEQSLTDMIGRAIAAEAAGSSEWVSNAVSASGANRLVSERVRAKRITRERLTEIIGVLVIPESRVLLAPATASDAQSTAMETKLRLAGASESLIDRAKALRAAATRREAELFSAAIMPEDATLGDLRERLLAIAVPEADARRGRRAAAEVFAAIFSGIREAARDVDPDRMFSADPFLLMGEVCELSDLCICDWG